MTAAPAIRGCQVTQDHPCDEAARIKYDWGIMPRIFATGLVTVAVMADSRVITYGRLLQSFFSVEHDPTELNRQFHRVEDYHQDFLERNPSHPYIVVNDLPKIAALERSFADFYRAKPGLEGR